MAVYKNEIIITSDYSCKIKFWGIIPYYNIHLINTI